MLPLDEVTHHANDTRTKNLKQMTRLSFCLESWQSGGEIIYNLILLTKSINVVYKLRVEHFKGDYKLNRLSRSCGIISSCYSCYSCYSCHSCYNNNEELFCQLLSEQSTSTVYLITIFLSYTTLKL